MAAKIELNEALSGLFAYWRSKRRRRALPARCDIDPAEIPGLMPYVMMLDLCEGRLRYRLVSKEIEHAYGIRLLRQLLEDVLTGDRLRIALATYGLVLQEKRPVASRSTMLTADGRELLVTRLVLPLSGNAQDVDSLLVGVALPDLAEREPLGTANTTEAARFVYEFL